MTFEEFDLLLRKKIAESGVKVKWETGKKSKGATTIGAIFVPRAPTQEQLNRTPEEKERLNQVDKQLWAIHTQVEAFSDEEKAAYFHDLDTLSDEEIEEKYPLQL